MKNYFSLPYKKHKGRDTNALCLCTYTIAINYIVNGQRLLVNGYWSMANGQWSMVNGQWLSPFVIPDVHIGDALGIGTANTTARGGASESCAAECIGSTNGLKHCIAAGKLHNK